MGYDGTHRYYSATFPLFDRIKLAKCYANCYFINSGSYVVINDALAISGFHLYCVC